MFSDMHNASRAIYSLSLHDALPIFGLFWTTEIPVAGVDVHLGKGSASLQASDVAILDYGNIPNALFGGGPPPTSGTVSLDRKSTRLNSSHRCISYAVFCLKKKKKTR